MRVPAVDRTIPAPRGGYVPLHNGDHMDAETFHALYEQTPEGFKAELIGGIVYVASPVTFQHGRPHARAIMWLGAYFEFTPGTEVLDNATNLLGESSELQPDASLLIRPEFGGQTTEEEGYIRGAPELVAEISYSTRGIDLYTKKREYEKAGVKEYIVFLAEERQIRWHVRGRKGFVEIEPEVGLLKSRFFPGLWLDPNAFFDRDPSTFLAAVRSGVTSPEHAKFVAKLAARRSKERGRP